jgi:hypothetical protein
VIKRRRGHLGERKKGKVPSSSARPGGSKRPGVIFEGTTLEVRLSL